MSWPTLYFLNRYAGQPTGPDPYCHLYLVPLHLILDIRQTNLKTIGEMYLILRINLNISDSAIRLHRFPLPHLNSYSYVRRTKHNIAMCRSSLHQPYCFCICCFPSPFSSFICLCNN